MTPNPIIVSRCDRTGNMVRPWAESGWECWCVDTQHSIRRDRVERVGAGVIRFIWGDVRSWCPPNRRIAMLFGFPPCTHLAVSGARDMRKKSGWMLADALQLFDSCMMTAAYARCPYVNENPMGRLNTHRRPPDYTFHPWEYAGYLPDPQAENTSKLTCLWTGGGFVMPPKRPAPEPHREDCWLAGPSDERADIRAETPAGFALAVYLANAPKIESEAAEPRPLPAAVEKETKNG